MTNNVDHAEYPRLLEVLADVLLNILPGAISMRTRDVIQIDYRGEQGITILLTPEVLEMRLPTIIWTQGAHGPVPSSRLWKRLPLARVGDPNELGTLDRLQELTKACLERRSREFKLCRYCKEKFPIERMSGRACHGCASHHLGVVY
jgi:hypothetical protein